MHDEWSCLGSNSCINEALLSLAYMPSNHMCSVFGNGACVEWYLQSHHTREFIRICVVEYQLLLHDWQHAVCHLKELHNVNFAHALEHDSK